METEKQSPLIPVEEARSRVLDGIPILPRKRIPVTDSNGFVSYGDITAPNPIPHFDNSAMDGFAVRHSELSNATRENPVPLKVAFEVSAGSQTTESLIPGACARIFTGAPIPPNTSAVVMQEEVAMKDGYAFFIEPPKPWEFVRFAGEDVESGSVILKQGQIINNRSMGLLQAVGVESLEVSLRPKISILATGSELVLPGHDLKHGQIYESNRSMIAGFTSQAGGEPNILPLATDDLDHLKVQLESACEDSDFIISTGGISVGKYDFVREAWKQIGGTWDTSRINMKPGKPFSLGIRDNVRLFALPGNPGSAAMSFMIFVFPAIRSALQACEIYPRSFITTAPNSITNSISRSQFLRVSLDENNQISPKYMQASHSLTSLAQSDGYIQLHPKSTLQPGSPIAFTPWPQ